jgi:hypothetical protein
MWTGLHIFLSCQQLVASLVCSSVFCVVGAFKDMRLLLLGLLEGQPLVVGRSSSVWIPSVVALVHRAFHEHRCAVDRGCGQLQG